MASPRLPNDWADMIKAQSNFHFNELQKERSLEALNKELYKSELERQLKEKSQKRIRELQESRAETQLMTEQIKLFKAEQKRKQDGKKDLQNFLSSEYSTEIQKKHYQKKQEAVVNLKEDQEILNNAKKQLDNLIDFNRNMKVQKTVEEKNFLNTKINEKDLMAKQKEVEKKTDQVQILDNIHKLTQLEMQKQENLRKIQRIRDERAKVYEPVISDMFKKESQKKQVIENWERQIGRRQEEEELKKLQMKLENKRKLADGLKNQIEEKESNRNLQVRDFYDEKYKMDEAVRSYRSDMEERKNNQIKSQKEYFEFLKMQKMDFDLRNRNQNVMSPKEKGVNQDLLKKIENKEDVEFRGVPGYHPRVSPLQVSFSRAYKGSAENGNLSGLRSSSQTIYHYENVEPQSKQKIRLNPEIYSMSNHVANDPLVVGSNNANYKRRGFNSIDSGNIFRIS